MPKVSIAPGLFSPPMPVSLVGALVDSKPNFMTVAWLVRVNFDPPMLAVAIGPGHHTPRGIRENKTFSVCLPGAALLQRCPVRLLQLLSRRRVGSPPVVEETPRRPSGRLRSGFCGVVRGPV